jgi:hypothetical protein
VIGTTSASAALPTFQEPPLPLHFANGREIGLGFNLNASPNAVLPVLPVGSRFAVTYVLVNGELAFGKSSGARVGRILIECTVLAETPDGMCDGIAHLPDGFITFSGNGPFTRSKVEHWAITGGVGAYANVRGEITVTTVPGGANAVVYFAEELAA